MPLVAVEKKHGELSRFRAVVKRQADKVDDLQRPAAMRKWTSGVEQILDNARNAEDEVELKLQFGEKKEEFTSTAVEQVFAELKEFYPEWFADENNVINMDTRRMSA